MGFVKYYHSINQKSYCIKHCMGQSHAFRKHSHEEYSIALVTGGESLFKFVDEAFVIKKGQLVIIGPHFAHQCRPNNVLEWAFYMLHVSSAWIQETGLEIQGVADFSIFDLPSMEYERIAKCFEKSCLYNQETEENVILIVESAFSKHQTTEIEWNFNNSDEERLKCVYDDISVRYKENISLNEMSKLSNLDKYSLIRLFKKKYNTTPHSWQVMLRINEAKKMLENGCSISQAAIEVGFYDQSHFSKVFKETYGVTPKQFIKA